MLEPIKNIQDEIVEEFAFFEDWMQRYEHMISLGKSLPLIAPEFKNDDHIIKGCQSKVWVHAALEDNKLVFNCRLRRHYYQRYYCHSHTRLLQSKTHGHFRRQHRFYR